MAASEDDLRAALEQRFKGDRSGACIAAAVIESGTTAQAYFCANAKSERSIDDRTAFEIGSITKTMTAALLAAIDLAPERLRVGFAGVGLGRRPGAGERMIDDRDFIANEIGVRLVEIPRVWKDRSASGHRPTAIVL